MTVVCAWRGDCRVCVARQVVHDTEGYSGSDMAGLCREAAMEPLRDEGMREALLARSEDAVRAVLALLPYAPGERTTDTDDIA